MRLNSNSPVRRGPASRAELSPALLPALHERYGFSSSAEVHDLGGSSNLNLRLTDQAQSYVVRVYRPWVTAARLDDMQQVRRVLAQGGIPVVQPILTRDSASWIAVDNRLVEVEPFVGFDEKMDTWPRLAQGLQLLGRIHRLMLPLQVSVDGSSAPACNNLAIEDALSGTLAGTQRVRQWGATARELQVVEASEELVYLVDRHRAEVSALPRQLVHGDYWDNNVFFRAGRIVQVADLDFMGERARIDDLALTLYYTNSTFSEDQTSDERIRQLRALVDAYDTGTDQPLTEAERSAFPLALARVPLAFIAMIAVIDSEEGAHGMVAGMEQDIAWALNLMHNLDRWQSIFARKA